MEIKRLLSLDVFRGITIAAMILVNNPGTWDHVYPPLLHAKWNGITPTDLIYPFFLFIVGVAIAFAYTRRLKEGAPMGAIYSKLFIRALKIYAVGVFLTLLPYFNVYELRYTGVLQRISIVFLVCGLLFLKTTWRTQVIVGLLLLLGYWAAMTLIPTPGYDKAMLDPGVNLAAWIDSKFLPGKMWQGTWDPEGILSTLPAFVTTITGMLTGRFLLSDKTWEEKVIWMFISGFTATILGTVWGWVFPINKNIWTSSYVLLTSGLAVMTLATIIFLMDMKGYKKGTEFALIYGSNAIAVYVLADILSYPLYLFKFGGKSLNMHFQDFFTGVGFSPEFVSLCYALLYVGILFIPAYILYRKKIFIKL